MDPETETEMDIENIAEHMEVVGSDGEHVGIVDDVDGDQIKLTRNDADAGGQHHLLPTALVASVEDKVMLSVSAAQAKEMWEAAG